LDISKMGINFELKKPNKNGLWLYRIPMSDIIGVINLYNDNVMFLNDKKEYQNLWYWWNDSKPLLTYYIGSFGKESLCEHKY